MEILKSNPMAKAYLGIAGVCLGVGIVSGRLSGLVLLAIGGVATSKAVQELRKTNLLHDGNDHVANAPLKSS